MVRCFSGALGGSQALGLREQPATLRGDPFSGASLPGIGQLALHPAALRQLLEAGLLAQSVAMLALAAIPRRRPLGR